jgi:glycosyltransferase involved in cell wall biosynthesis
MMSGRPEVSVVMAVRNEAPFLEASAGSILEQTLADLELIVVDDGSEDETPDLLRELARTDRRVVLLRNAAPAGLTAALNTALARASGRFAARMDGDDRAYPERLRLQRDRLDADPGLFLLGAGIRCIDEQGRTVRRVKTVSGVERVAATLRCHNCIAHPTVMFRNDGSVQYRTKFRYAQDYDLFLRLVAAGRRLDNLPEVLLDYRVRAQSVSCDSAGQQWLFAERAKEIARSGDPAAAYDAFDPAAILGVDAATATEPRFLRRELHARLAAGDFARARGVLRRYFRAHGLLNRYLLLWPWTFMRERVAR